MTHAIGVDIGGTKIAGGVVDEHGALLAKVRRPTPHDDAQALVATVVEVVRALADEHAVSAVGVGVPGFVNAARDGVLVAPNLAWPRTGLTGPVSEATGLPTVLENDGNAAAWAEHAFGAGVDRGDLLLVAAGTGIGGGMVLDGRLHRGAAGIAAEIGHLRVVPDGARCGCGARGCWEAYASGGAMTRWAREAVATGRAGEVLTRRCGNDPALVDGAMISAAARDGDRFSADLFARVGSWLGQGIASLITVADPAVVVLGGGLSAAEDLLLGPVRAALTANLSGGAARPVPAVVPARLGNDAGIVGAADLASRQARPVMIV